MFLYFFHKNAFKRFFILAINVFAYIQTTIRRQTFNTYIGTAVDILVCNRIYSGYKKWTDLEKISTFGFKKSEILPEKFSTTHSVNRPILIPKAKDWLSLSLE